MTPTTSKRLLCCFLFAGYLLLGAFAGTGILLGILPAHRQPATVTDTAIAANLNQALDVKRNLTAQVAFDLDMMFDIITQFADVVFGKIPYSGVRINLSIGQNRL